MTEAEIVEELERMENEEKILEKAKHLLKEYTFENGDTYKGNIEKGKFEGYGTYTEKSTGNKFCGIWEKGSRFFGEQIWKLG